MDLSGKIKKEYKNSQGSRVKIARHDLSSSRINGWYRLKGVRVLIFRVISTPIIPETQYLESPWIARIR